MEKLAFSPREVGELLGLGRSATYEALSSGRIPHIRVGRKILIPKAGLVKLLSEGQPETAGMGNEGTGQQEG